MRCEKRLSKLLWEDRRFRDVALETQLAVSQDIPWAPSTLLQWLPKSSSFIGTVRKYQTSHCGWGKTPDGSGLLFYPELNVT